MVDSFNYRFENGLLTISQWLAIISLISQKHLQNLQNWRPASLLKNDYKIGTKAIALRMEKVLPKLLMKAKQIMSKVGTLEKVLERFPTLCRLQKLITSLV